MVVLKTQTTQSITVRQTNTYVADEGSGTPTVFLHGIGDSSDMWQGMIAHMKSSMRCIAPDLPGFGRSGVPQGYVPSLEAMGNWLHDFVDVLAISEPLNLVITDIGGQYGLTWAIQHPDRVRRIALVGATNFFADYKWHSIAQLLRKPILGELLMSAMNPKRFAQSMRDTNKSPSFMTDSWLRSSYALGFSQATARKMALTHYRLLDPRQFADWEPKLKELTSKVPMLILWGDKDPYIQPSFAERFGAREIEHFRDCGHWLAVEAPQLAAQRVMKFFA